jgi:PAS domain S-box-containing protein
MRLATKTRNALGAKLGWITGSPLLLFFAIVVLATLPVLIIGLQSDRVYVQSTIKAELAESANVSNLSAVLIEEHFSQYVTLLNSYAIDAELRRQWQARQMPAIQEHMERALSLQQDATIVSIYDVNGTLRAIAPHDPQLIGQSFAHRDWYKGVITRWEPYVSEVYRPRAAPQTLSVAVAVPIKDDNGKAVGIIAAAYSLQRISRWLPSSGDRNIRVVDQKGQLLATPGIDVFAPPKDLSGFDVVKKVLAGEEGSGVLSHESGEGHAGEGEFLVTYKPIRSFGWGVLTFEPNQIMSERAGHLRRQNILFGLMVTLLAVVSGWFIMLLSRRQQKLAGEVQSLALSEERYRGLVENAVYGILRADETGFLSVNPAFARMLGYDTAAEVLRLDPGKELWFEAQQRKQLFAKYAEGVPYVDEEITLRRKDGTPITVHASGRASRDGEGKLILETIVEDVTERRALERQLRQAQKMDAIGRLAGGVAHDFNNLLTVIAGYTDLTAEALGQQHPLRKELDEVKKATARATSLTRQLLAFSRQQVLEPRVMDVNASIRSLDSMLQRTLGERIKLDMKLGESAPVKADPGQIDQVVLNLVLNSRDALGEKSGRIGIETAVVELDDAYAKEHLGVNPGRYVMLAVSDNGQGMDPETQAHVFEPFFTTKPSDRGTGLGLSTVYGVVKQSGGHIWLYSEKGVGTTFKVYLPIATGGVPSAAPPPPVSTNARGRGTVLIVEDEDGVRELTRQILSRAGYQVLLAAEPGEALALFNEHAEEITLLLTDVVLQNMSGRELAQRIEGKSTKIRVLYMSGYTDDAVLHNGVLNAGAQFLQKPFTTETLLRKVQEVLGAR